LELINSLDIVFITILSKTVYELLRTKNPKLSYVHLEITQLRRAGNVEIEEIA